MRDYKHENLVQFIGVACQKEPLMIIVEFCGGGSLLKVCFIQITKITQPFTVKLLILMR